MCLVLFFVGSFDSEAGHLATPLKINFKIYTVKTFGFIFFFSLTCFYIPNIKLTKNIPHIYHVNTLCVWSTVFFSPRGLANFTYGYDLASFYREISRQTM